jgi:hypothetical protein
VSGTPIETFPVGPATARSVRGGLWALAFCTLFWLGGAGCVVFLVILNPAEMADVAHPVAFSCFLLGGFLGFAALSALATWYYYRVWKRLPTFAMKIDEDGIWPDAFPKQEFLVRWQDIRTVRWRPLMWRLDIIGLEGQVLLRVEHCLTNFCRLFELIAERSPVGRNLPALPVTLTRSRIYQAIHASGVLFMTAFFILGCVLWTLPPRGTPLGSLLFAGASALCIWMLVREFAGTVSRVVVSGDKFAIGYPFSSREYRWEDTNAVALRYSGALSFVEVSIIGVAKSVRLIGMNADAPCVYLILSRARDVALSRPATPTPESGP